MKDFSFNPNYTSLTHATAMAKLLYYDVDEDYLKRAYIPRLTRRLEEFSQSEELLFFSIAILTELDEREIAIRYLIRFLKSESKSAIAWTLLGRALRELDECLATACMCKAMLLKKNPNISIEIERELISCLESLRYFDDWHRFDDREFHEEGALLADEALNYTFV